MSLQWHTYYLEKRGDLKHTVPLGLAMTCEYNNPIAVNLLHYASSLDTNNM